MSDTEADLQRDIAARRTFAIISHPDAGKTTMTEKLLLLGSAIQVAGSVKGKRGPQATSDWMSLEQERGISVTSSVMQFPYRERIVNLLDTPGHEDFSEDTYRTLTAVDSALMLIDGAKGVEDRTIKLMNVCRLRDTPIVSFVNKLDRDIRDPIELLDEVEAVLGIAGAPINWPIGMGKDLKGVYNLYTDTLHLFEAGHNAILPPDRQISRLESDEAKELLDDRYDIFCEEIELVRGASHEFDLEQFLAGKLTPVFFGTALGNFGVREMLDQFVEWAPKPLARATQSRTVDPFERQFSGFVFKIHANIDPRHRDRIAFVRVCSGKFERNKFYTHVRLEKQLKFANPATFLASSKNVVDEAFPGDVVGLYDTGNFKIGDTLTEGEPLMFRGIPSFSPEIFKELINKDPMKSKQLDKGIRQLTEEGVAQVFYTPVGNRKIVGTVGELQFEVIKYRLENEYGAKCEFQPKNYFKACWLTSDNEEKLMEFKRIKGQEVVKDKDGLDVFLAPSPFMLDMERQNYPDIEFHFTSEFKLAEA